MNSPIPKTRVQTIRFGGLTVKTYADGSAQVIIADLLGRASRSYSLESAEVDELVARLAAREKSGQLP